MACPVITTKWTAHFGGMSWPRPGEALTDLAYRMRYSPERVSPSDLLMAVSVLDAYDALIAKPAYRSREIVRVIKSVAGDASPAQPAGGG